MYLDKFLDPLHLIIPTSDELFFLCGQPVMAVNAIDIVRSYLLNVIMIAWVQQYTQSHILSQVWFLNPLAILRLVNVLHVSDLMQMDIDNSPAPWTAVLEYIWHCGAVVSGVQVIGLFMVFIRVVLA